MSDPILSDVRVTARPLDEPREGLPPCARLALFENRIACINDRSICGHYGLRFVIHAGRNPETYTSKWHPDCKAFTISLADLVLDLETDDPTQAKAAFERGAKWVRTGEGP